MEEEAEKYKNMTEKERQENTISLDELFEDLDDEKKGLKELVHNIAALQNEAVLQTLQIWKPKAENIINTKSKDINAIEHTLDALCEVAFDDEILIMFKKLCRYYYDIDPQATAEQIQFYREMWDNNDDIESNE